MSDLKLDRLAMRARPEGNPVMHQRWENLLFLHWPIEAALLRPLLPASLELDTFEGKAWIGLTPFHLEDVRPPMVPAFPALSSFHELNVRTYVAHAGEPGIWFFSLDASKILPTVAARIFFMQPYYKAAIRYLQTPETCAFSMSRQLPMPAEFKASWRIGQRLRDPDTDSLAFFLVERYCMYAVEGDNLYRARIYHHPWILDDAEVELRSSTMLSALGLPEPTTEPLAHFARSMEVEVWAPERVASVTRVGPRPENITRLRPPTY